jgi:hypothetical protein
MSSSAFISTVTRLGGRLRGGLLLLGLAVLTAPLAFAAPPDKPRTLVVLDFEQEGDLGDEDMVATRRLRMQNATQELKRRLVESGMYEVVDDAPARPMIDRLKSSQYLNRCNGCELDIARVLGADAVLVPWIFRMSQLVVTMHFEMKDVASGRLLMKRALDFRNDVDASWSREIDYLVRDLLQGKLWNGDAPESGLGGVTEGKSSGFMSSSRTPQFGRSIPTVLLRN